MILRYLRGFMCYRQKPTDDTWGLVWHKKGGKSHVGSGVEELVKGHDHFKPEINNYSLYSPNSQFTDVLSNTLQSITETELQIIRQGSFSSVSW